MYQQAWQEVSKVLDSKQLGSLSQVCAALRVVCKFEVARRISDASLGQECHPVPFANEVDGNLFADFHYVRACVRLDGEGRPIPFHGSHGSTLQGARACSSCTDCCSNCLCCRDPHGNPVYSNEGRVDVLGGGGVHIPFPIVECGAACECSPEGGRCEKRVVASGPTHPFVIIRSETKGWSLFARSEIPAGAFVVEYAGEYLSVPEAKARQARYEEEKGGDRFLMVLRETMPSRRLATVTNIDATYFSNVARFINHECGGGNLISHPVRSAGEPLPRAAFFARRDIMADEELTYSYNAAGETGEEEGAPIQSDKACFCGSATCTGFLPAQIGWV